MKKSHAEIFFHYIGEGLAMVIMASLAVAVFLCPLLGQIAMIPTLANHAIKEWEWEDGAALTMALAFAICVQSPIQYLAFHLAGRI